MWRRLPLALCLSASPALASGSGDCDSAQRMGRKEGEELYAGVAEGDACERIAADAQALFLEALTLRRDLIEQGLFEPLPGLEEEQECRWSGQMTGILRADETKRASCAQ